MTATIAVGLDLSASSLTALRWAVQAAAAGGTRTLAVIAKPRVGKGLTPESARISASRAEEHVQDVRTAIRRVASDADLDVLVIEGNPTEVLIGISDQVDLLVVGRHADHGWRDVMTPSLPGRLATRTAAALCVVTSVPEPPRGRIIVGHDGPASDPAARYAAHQANLRGAELMVVTTWSYPADTRATSADASVLLEEGAAAGQAAVVRALRDSHPAVHITTTVRLGNPVEVLAEFAKSADMVVVGSHRQGLRHTGVARLVVGSVAGALIRRSAVPVLVVPHG